MKPIDSAYIAVLPLSFDATAYAQASNTLWMKLYEGPGNDYGYCLDVTNDGGYAIAGSYFLDVGNTDFHLIKTDESGDTPLTYYSYLREHWQSLKTTSSIESIFSPVKLRTNAARRINALEMLQKVIEDVKFKNGIEVKI